MTDHDESAVIAPLAGTQALPASSSDRRTAVLKTFSALQHRNYRLYFFGQLVSLTGTWMQNVAQAWLVYYLTQSPLYLGIVSFAASLPILSLSLGAGVYIDRLPKRWLLVRTQSAAMILAFLLSADVFLGWVQPWHIVIFSFLLGTVNAFDGPGRQSFVVDMVGKEDLPNAIALNSTIFNSARIFGPTIAGITLALVGAAWCFFLNGVSFIAVIIALLLMVVQDKAVVEKTASVAQQAREGLTFIWHHQSVRTLLGMVAVSNLFAFGYSALMPAFAQDVLGQGPTGLGLMSAAVGAGAIIGALLVATLGRIVRKGRMLTAGNLLFPAMVLLFSNSTSYFLSLFLLVLIGICFMIQNNMTNTLIQTSIPDELRGRVMSIFTLVFMGLFPIGSLLAGTVAEHFTIPLGAAFGGAIALAFGIFWFWRAPYVRELP